MEITVQPGEGRGIPCMLILLGNEDRQRLYGYLRQYESLCSFVFISGFDWNADLSPWPAIAAFKGAEDFRGGAGTFLSGILTVALQKVDSVLGYEPAWYGMAGYSMAGLFAIYSLYRTDVFSRVVSASGSLWFDGFLEYACSHDFAGNPEKVYFSLGSTEGRTRNKRLKSVGEDTSALYEWYKTIGVKTIFEINNGNHFLDPESRLAKGIAWTLCGACNMDKRLLNG